MVTHQQHYKAALHVLKYLISTSSYVISYHSNAYDKLQAFNQFPNHHDTEAYSDTTSPSPADFHKLTSYSDACWGGQFGNHMKDDYLLELFKFCSLSGILRCRSGGAIAWKFIFQKSCSQLVQCWDHGYRWMCWRTRINQASSSWLRDDCRVYVHTII